MTARLPPMRRLLLVPVLLLALSACTREAPLPGEPVDDSPQGKFFAALTEEPSAASDRSAPGSAARRYVDFQAALAQARVDASVEPVQTEVRRSADGYLLCEREDGKPHCAEVTDVVLDGELVRSFAVDGKQIRGRFAATGKDIDAGAAGTVQLIAAYEQPSTQELWVIVRLAAGARNVSLHLAHGSWTAKDGDGVTGTKVLQASRLEVLPAGQGAAIAAVVPRGRLGGTLRLAFVVAGEKVFVDVPVRR